MDAKDMRPKEDAQFSGGPEGPGGPPPAGYTESYGGTDWIVTESCTFENGIALYEGSLPKAPEGKALLMCVDGVVTGIKPGVYPGNVALTVYTLTTIDRSQSEMTSGNFRTALHIKDGELIPGEISWTAGEYVAAEGEIRKAVIRTDIDKFNGIIAEAGTLSEKPYILKDCEFRFDGAGNSEGGGAGVVTVGKANVLVDGALFWNVGSASAIVASGESRLAVQNSVIYGRRNFKEGKLCPWVLGINGNNRLTNAIDSAQVSYRDSIVVAESWAALSTDAGHGVRLTGDRVFSGIGRLEEYNPRHADRYTAVPECGGKRYGFTLGNSAIGESGYINYADTGFHNSFRDVEFWSPDYVFILSTGQASIDVSGDSRCHSGRVGVLWHKNQGGTVQLNGGKWYAEQTLFLCKSYSDTDPSGCWCHAVADGTDISLGKEGVIYQLMTSDDIGLGPTQYTVPETEWSFDTLRPLPETYRTQKTENRGPFGISRFYLENGKELKTEEPEDIFLKKHPNAEPLIWDAPNRIHPTYLSLRNLSADGDIYNGVYQRIQELVVELDHASVRGRISSANTFHVDAQGMQLPAGTVIDKNGREDAHLGIGRVRSIAAKEVNNPVHLILKNGAVWNAKGQSFLHELEWEDGAVIRGSVLVDGVSVAESGHYTGEIVVTEC